MQKQSVVHAIIYGRVQGIGYRWFVEDTARSMGLNGWVRNLDNGNVEVEAEGEKEALEGFLDTLKNGHSGASVKDIKVDWTDSKENSFAGFEIRY